MGKKLIILIIILILAIVIVASAVGFLFISKKGEKQNIKKPDIRNLTNNSNLVIKEEYLGYILNELGAYNLHAPPLSDEKPTIKFNIDSEFFTSEIENSKIIIQKGNFGNEDLLFTTTKIEIINAINSDDMKGYFVESVKSGKISFEIKADKGKLLLKGYLSLYKELTGSEITPDQIE